MVDQQENNDRDGETIAKAVTIKRKHVDMANEMAYALGREDTLTGDTNFSGVVRDAIEFVYREMDWEDGDELEPATGTREGG